MKVETTSSDIRDGQVITNARPAKATLWAFVIAVVLLITLVLPAEYGIDLTGAGRMLGLTSMGERKVAAASSTTATIAAAITPASASKNNTTAAQYSTLSTLPLRFDEIEVKLAPNGQVEYKTVLAEGESLVHSWDAGGANLEFDFHGEPASGPSGAFLSFHKGTASKSGGSLRAPFTGTHGWYWKNLTDRNVVIKLRVAGFYSGIKRL